MNRSVKRIMIDCKEIMNDPIEHIYYRHDEDNVYKGYALIIGPKDTPYEDGFYFFEFTFNDSYPFNPPKVKFHTYDGFTRFNPNLYINGNVCLSILNTWEGEKWSSCQSIRSVLLTLSTVLNETPLLNEPGITKHHKDFDSYHELLLYKNVEISMLKYLEKGNLNYNFREFHPIMVKHFISNYESIKKKIQRPSKHIEMSIYSNIYCQLDYAQLNHLVDVLFSQLKTSF